MKKALLIKTTGEKVLVFPKDKKTFALKELQEYVGGFVGIAPMPGARRLLYHDEGKLIGLPVNPVATEIWKDAYPIAEYPENNDELIVGDILVAGRNLEELL